jgi:hypothetical protein
MKTRTVILGGLWLACNLAADEPPKAPKTEAKTKAEAKLESDAKTFGVSVADLKKLREFGFADAEIYGHIQENKRTARQLITEREVVDDLAKALAEVNQRVYRMPEKKQASERERAMKDAIAKIRRERKPSREELREILTKTSFLRDDQLRRVVR